MTIHKAVQGSTASGLTQDLLWKLSIILESPIMAQSVEDIPSKIQWLEALQATNLKNQDEPKKNHHHNLETEQGAIDSQIDSYTGKLSNAGVNYVEQLKKDQEAYHILCCRLYDEIGQLETCLLILKDEIHALKNKN